MVKDSNLIVLS